MCLTIFLSCCVILIGYLFRLRRSTTKGKRLPGPTPLPLLGNLLQIGFRPHITYTKWAKLYGPIYGIKLGLKDYVIVSDYKLIKELFNESVATGRMGDNPIVMEFTKGPYGIVNSSGSTWLTQRNFTVRTLRSLGFAKTSMETMILDEVQIMLDWFRKHGSKPIQCREIFNAPVVNSLWRIVSGERCQWEESRPAILDAFEEFQKEIMNMSCNGLVFAPVLRFIVPNLFGWNRYLKSINAMMKLCQESIEKHKETFNSTNLRDYIDHHLLEIKNSNDPNSSFYNETGNANLMAVVFDLFLAGTITQSASLSWTLLYLSENQNIQKSLQKEINEVVGSALPSLSDRIKMPYSEAVISEILRITSVAPIGVPHTLLSDLDFYGYHFPMGTTIFANLYGVHHDPSIWGDSESFRPERFLNEDGTKFVQNEALIAFGEGKRMCIGETLGRDTLFLFVTSILQQFNILPNPENIEKADFEPDFGMMLGPKPFKVLVTPRKS